jgi:hypothetical protein
MTSAAGDAGTSRPRARWQADIPGSGTRRRARLAILIEEKEQPMTYTIVIDNAADLLAACVSDGDQDAISRELRDYRDQCSPEHAPDLEAIPGLTLTDEEPEDEDRIVWRGHDRGWLTDTAGTTYQYAVRA